MNNFLASHSLQVKFPAETTQEVSRAIDEGEDFTLIHEFSFSLRETKVKISFASPL
jgi:hypothetical protein